MHLARYTHRVAISNQRLVSLQDGNVSLRRKDYARGNHTGTTTLEAVEFMRRFLLHSLPKASNGSGTTASSPTSYACRTCDGVGPY